MADGRTVARHVVLVGLSGTGKTSIGKLVANRLGRAYADADAMVEERTGRTVREIFAEDGEAAFRSLEAEAMANALDASAPSVVAAGGGAVIAEATRTLLRRPDVFVVWLTAEPAFLASRAAGRTHRPLLDDDPVATLTRLEAERRPWFEEVADARVDVQSALATEAKPLAKARLAEIISGMVEDVTAARARDHLVVIGFMRAGKTTIGRRLAERLGRPHVDSDEQLVRRTGHSARELAGEQGLAGLHRLELAVLRDALWQPRPSVISAAASVVDTDAGRLALGTARHVVWLRVDRATLADRMVAGDHRPAVPDDVWQTRLPLFEEVATAVVDETVDDPDLVTGMVLDAIGAPVS